MLTDEHFFAQKETELSVHLNKIQTEAVLHHEGPLLLLASPGSGKTTTIIMRIGYLIEVQNVQANRIKAVTFSKASATDMTMRFERFFPKLPAVDFSTIHSLAFEIVRNDMREQGLSYQLIEGRVDQPFLRKKQILRRLYKEINDELIADDQLDELISAIGLIKNKLLHKKDWESVPCTVPEFTKIIEQYEEFKQNGYSQLLLDYDDMLTKAYEILADNPQTREHYQRCYDHILTDESQDTSLVQHKIIEKLVGVKQNLTVVADDDQSIYTWRAAEPQYLLDFEKVYPTARILKMEQNYRSDQKIVDVSNQFIKRNKNRYDKNMFTKNEQEGTVLIHTLPNFNHQEIYLAERIKEIKNYQEIAVLYRNNDSSILLVDAFDKAGIPFYMKDVDNYFFSHWVVEDILNFMRLAHSIHRADILERIHTKFNGFISKKQMEVLKGSLIKKSVFQTLIDMGSLKDYQIRNLEKCELHFNRMKESSPREIIQIIRHELGYQKNLVDMSKRLGFKIDHLLNILGTLEHIANNEQTMESFAKRLKYLEQTIKAAKHNEQAVTLSTFHSSKGLEFKNVFMIDLVEGIIPASSDETDSQIEEAVRLFYVGMTRAKSHLELLTYSMKNGKKVQTSRFLTDVSKIMYPNDFINTSEDSMKIHRKMKRKITLSENAVVEEKLLQIGVIVKHRVFGTGEIVKRSDHDLEIQFSKQKKLLSVETCLEMGLLEM